MTSANQKSQPNVDGLAAEVQRDLRKHGLWTLASEARASPGTRPSAAKQLFHLVRVLVASPLVSPFGRLRAADWAPRLFDAVRTSMPVLVVNLFLFFQSEVWIGFSALPRWLVAAVVGLLLLLVMGAVVSAIREAVDNLASTAKLSLFAKLNLFFVMFQWLLLRFLGLLAVTVAAYAALGLVLVDPAFTCELLQRDPCSVAALVDFDFKGQRFVVTEELIKVAALLGAFVVLYYAFLHERRSPVGLGPMVTAEKDELARAIVGYGNLQRARGVQAEAPAAPATSAG